MVSHQYGRDYFGGESSRILVVEDEAKVARALQENLEREEYTVVVARTGAQRRARRLIFMLAFASHQINFTAN